MMGKLLISIKIIGWVSLSVMIISISKAFLMEWKSATSYYLANGYLPPSFHSLYPALHSKISSITIPPQLKYDILVWQSSSDGSLSLKNAYLHFSPFSKQEWTNNLWTSFIPPRFYCLVWKVFLNRIPTQTALQIRAIKLLPGVKYVVLALNPPAISSSRAICWSHMEMDFWSFISYL